MPWGVYTIYLHNILTVEHKFSIDFASTLILVFGVGAGLGSAAAGVICHFLWDFSTPLTQLLLQQVASPRRRRRLLFHLPASHRVAFPALLRRLPPHTGPPRARALLSRPAAQRPGTLHPHHAAQRQSAAVPLHRHRRQRGLQQRREDPGTHRLHLLHEVGERRDMDSRGSNRVDALIRTTEFFYLAGVICFGLFYTYADDEQRVMEYVLAVQKQFQVDVESAKEALTLSALPHCEAISPDPAQSPKAMQRVMSLDSLRMAGVGVGHVLRRMKNAIKGREVRSLRNSAASNRGHEDDHLEEAPLLLKD